jgi:hypothetical protein
MLDVVRLHTMVYPKPSDIQLEQLWKEVRRRRCTRSLVYASRRADFGGLAGGRAPASSSARTVHSAGRCSFSPFACLTASARRSCVALRNYALRRLKR